MLYRSRVRLLRTRPATALPRWRAGRDGRGDLDLAALIGRLAPGKSFADIGGMWGINGEHSFVAERAGATREVIVDAERSEAFEARHRESESAIEVVLGDATDPETLGKVGEVDVVWCLGVLYHLPDPYRFLRQLRQICRETLVLELLTAPEMHGIRNGAVFLPQLPERDRTLWDVSGRAGPSVQYGITTPFAPWAGYANNFWALTPSCVCSLLETVGFNVEISRPSNRAPLRHLFVARSGGPVPDV